jgi:hypothetical protein
MPASAWPVWSLAILLPALVAGRPAAAAPEPPGPRVEYRDDRLTAHIVEAPLHEVLAAIGKATGSEVRGQPLDDRPVSVALDAVPLDDALHRLLGSQNFTLSYARDGRPKTIVLLGGPEAAPVPSERPTAAGVPVAPAGPTGPVFPLTLSHALMRVSGAGCARGFPAAGVALSGPAHVCRAGFAGRGTESALSDVLWTLAVRPRPETKSRGGSYSWRVRSTRRSRATASLCFSTSTLNSCEPSPRATK